MRYRMLAMFSAPLKRRMLAEKGRSLAPIQCHLSPIMQGDP
jgi:hypothetical protein